jgi:serine/threonine protein kinase
MQENVLEQVARRICEKRGMQFVKQVGEGTFKQTFHVVNRSDTPLALKIYKAAITSARSQREVNAMRRCNHKNIARLLSLETLRNGGQQYIAITEEFLAGGTMTSRGQLTISQCLAIGQQLVDAVAHIARLNLVHRDIKPDNIMFRQDGVTPVLTDFGVVRDLSDSSMTPTWAPRGPGTPFFSAPEQLNNQKNLIDWRTDQFALGIVMAYSVFSEHPYRVPGKSDRDLVDSVASRQLPADWFKDRAFSSGLISLPRMIAPWPIDRYRKPEQLQRAWGEQKG